MDNFSRPRAVKEIRCSEVGDERRWESSELKSMKWIYDARHFQQWMLCFKLIMVIHHSSAHSSRSVSTQSGHFIQSSTRNICWSWRWSRFGYRDFALKIHSKIWLNSFGKFNFSFFTELLSKPAQVYSIKRAWLKFVSRRCVMRHRFSLLNRLAFASWCHATFPIIIAIASDAKTERERETDEKTCQKKAEIG